MLDVLLSVTERSSDRTSLTAGLKSGGSDRTSLTAGLKPGGSEPRSPADSNEEPGGS
jgi:hypothetical protein